MATLANRNNNPGNLRDSSGGFQKFNSPLEGKAALYNDLTAKMTGTTTTGLGPNSTLHDFAKVYAPSSENDTLQYTANLANKLGVSPDTKIGGLTNRIDDFAKAIQENEGYKDTTQLPETKTVSEKQPQEKEGFFASMLRGITGPIVSSIARPIQLGAELLGATPEQVDIASSKVPFYGEGGYLATPKTYSDVTKDVGRAAQTAALGMPVGTLGQAVKFGAVSGAGSGLEQEGTLGGAVKGGLIGSALGAVGGGITKALESIPKSLVESSFKDLNPAQIEQALKTKSIGTASSLLNQSKKAVTNYGQQIEKLLSETSERGAGNFAVRSTLQQFPEFATEKGTQQMLAKIKRLLPSGSDGFEGMTWNRGEISGLIDKIANGTATLLEKNRVRSAIDSATTGGYAKLAKALSPSAGHDLAMTFANALRSEVQGSVKETQPIFAEFAKEISFKKAIEKAMKKNPGKLLQWRDIIPFLGGQALGGPLGGIGTVMLGRAAENPAAKFAAAKGIQAAGKVISPVTSRGGLVGQLINR